MALLVPPIPTIPLLVSHSYKQSKKEIGTLTGQRRDALRVASGLDELYYLIIYPSSINPFLSNGTFIYQSHTHIFKTRNTHTYPPTSNYSKWGSSREKEADPPFLLSINTPLSFYFF